MSKKGGAKGKQQASNVLDAKKYERPGLTSDEVEEFLDMMTARISDKNSREDIERVFKLFDSDRTGEVSLDNMKRVAKELGEDISPQELQEIIQRADLDGDGALTMDDFYQVMTKKTLPNCNNNFCT